MDLFERHGLLGAWKHADHLPAQDSGVALSQRTEPPPVEPASFSRKFMAASSPSGPQ